jgi:hypothetical protein
MSTICYIFDSCIPPLHAGYSRFSLLKYKP